MPDCVNDGRNRKVIEVESRELEWRETNNLFVLSTLN